MQLRFIGGSIHSTMVSGAAIVKGRAVRVSSADKWEHCGNGEKPTGIALMDHRVISSGFNIYDSSYGEGLDTVYDGRRNPYKVQYGNVGEPLGVLMGGGNVIDDLPYLAYTGTVVRNALLTSGASGVWKATTAGAGDAGAQVIVPGARSSRDTIGIVTL